MLAFTILASIIAYVITEHYFANMGWAIAPLFFVATQLHFVESNSRLFKRIAFFLLVIQITSAWLEKTLISYCVFTVHVGMLLFCCKLRMLIGIPAKKSADMTPEVLVEAQVTAYENTVRLYYTLYNPSKLSIVPELLKIYKGKEASLLNRLETKYGLITTELIQDKLQQYYTVRNPSKLLEVLEKYKDRESVLFEKLEKKLGPRMYLDGDESAAQQSNLKIQEDSISAYIEEKVHLFYRLFNPSKLADVPELLEKYKDREDVLLDKLEKKYGPITPKLIEDKLRQFYSVHNPSKLSDVSGILQRYKGRESTLFCDLEKKYC